MSGKDRRIKRHETTSTVLAEIDLRAKGKDEHIPTMFLVFIQSRMKKKKIKMNATAYVEVCQE